MAVSAPNQFLVAMLIDWMGIHSQKVNLGNIESIWRTIESGGGKNLGFNDISFSVMDQV